MEDRRAGIQPLRSELRGSAFVPSEAVGELRNKRFIPALMPSAMPICCANFASWQRCASTSGRRRSANSYRKHGIPSKQSARSLMQDSISSSGFFRQRCGKICLIALMRWWRQPCVFIRARPAPRGDNQKRTHQTNPRNTALGATAGLQSGHSSLC